MIDKLVEFFVSWFANPNPWGIGLAIVFGAIWLAGGTLSFGLANYLFCWDSQNKTRRGHPALALLALLPYAVGVVLLS